MIITHRYGGNCDVVNGQEQVLTNRKRSFSPNGIHFRQAMCTKQDLGVQKFDLQSVTYYILSIILLLILKVKPSYPALVYKQCSTVPFD